MHRWRVGTVSLGILLIALGLAMLIAQLKQASILETLLMWWPILLILIGGEILWRIYSVKEQQPKVRYDVFSIFIILLIVFFSMGMYALTSTGIVEQVARAVSSRNITVEIPRQEVNISNDVEDIVIKLPRERLSIERGGNNQLVVFGTALVRAGDRDEAESMLEQGNIITYHEGGTLFVQFVPPPRSGDIRPGVYDMQYTLLVPKGKRIRTESSGYYNLTVAPKALENMWLVNGRGRIVVTVDAGSDLVVEARVDDAYRLKGNVLWEIEEILDRDGIRYEGAKGRLKLGNGKYKVTITDGDEVVVNEVLSKP